ncbi:uncharacterized protein LOC123427755 [Hordeum vulgare subsp. vulgare]|uniref:PWWP domain-containing protein n=1 Tax=Hordeum vulgare subsp. vulgare TaxID=112509 RepID=A0A8I6X712_HORVV|nr:uncharacterized protein LOC123427755 [Hordeum vulgare subsp. vulgare]
MGRSSGGEGGGGEGQGEADGGGIADCSPGAIVWVRRRNGSWWPGRILGQDELLASQLVTPRTGTPVKLLGREDASVDWYNLEKSKRVKEFRCGEFDACIEKAMSCQGTPSKRREKYARREDAILHALELERKQLASKYQNQGFRADDGCSILFADTGREFDEFPSEYYSRNNVQEPQMHLQSSASQQRVDLSTTRYKSKKSKKQKGDNSVLLGKTKACEEKFIHAGSKRNLSGSLALEASGNTLSNHVNGFSRSGNMQEGSNEESGEKNTALKKRRLEEAIFEASVVKKHDRCRPLAQVVHSSVKFPRSFQCNDDFGTVVVEGGKDPLPAICQAKISVGATYLSADSGDAHSRDFIPVKKTVLIEAHHETESYIKQQDTLLEEQTFPDFVEKHESDSLMSLCSDTETEDDAELLQRYAKVQSPESDACDPNSLQASNKLRHANDIDDDDEMNFSTHIPQQNVLLDENGSPELGVSQWHMKGKRNQRNAVKRPIRKADENLALDSSSSFMKGLLKMANKGDSKVESIGASSHQPFGQSFPENQEGLDCDPDGAGLFDKAASHSGLNIYYGKDYPSSSKPTRDIGRNFTSFNGSEISCKTSLLNKNGNQISSRGQEACGEGSSLYQQNHGSHVGYMGAVLFNVDLKVQANYQGEHVPLVSLMSRLDGKAIVGHPIQVGILEEGSMDRLISGSDLVLENSTAAALAWPTGRRTAMPRVPRSNSSRATLDGNASGGLLEMKATNEKGGKNAKRNTTSVRRPFSQKSQKKPSNFKKASSPSQKTRTLSSVSIGKRPHREGNQAKAHRQSDVLGGLLKSDGAIPLVTCVPAKVVFSRIMEAVGRPSHALARRARKASPAVRDPP